MLKHINTNFDAIVIPQSIEELDNYNVLTELPAILRDIPTDAQANVQVPEGTTGGIFHVINNPVRVQLQTLVSLGGQGGDIANVRDVVDLLVDGDVNVDEIDVNDEVGSIELAHQITECH